MDVLNGRKKSLKPKYIGFNGMIIPFISHGMIMLIIMLHSSWFSWTDHFLSDLGNYKRLGDLALLFNLGLVMCGIFLLSFGLGFTWILNQEFQGYLRLLAVSGALFLTGAGVALTCIGLFSEDFGSIHGYSAVLFVVFTLFSMGFIGLAMLFKVGMRLLGIIGVTIVMGFIGPIILYLYFYIEHHLSINTAIPVLLSSLSVGFWLFLQAHRIYKLELQ
ncbi:MAG: DUF998 domain-containing protein [Candidatus Hermodarchaeota archaeon]